MGVTSLTQPDDHYSLSLTLGGYEVTPLDMLTGASTLADMGVKHMPDPFISIQNAAGQNVFVYDPNKNATRAVSAQVSYILAAIMSDDRNRCLEFGCGGDLTLPGRKVAAKTGTTQDFHDNWTLGFTPTLATAVWVGNPNNKPLANNSTGIVGAAPIWHKYMQQALRGVPNQWYAKPAGLQQIGDNYFLPGTENLPSPVLGWPVCQFGSYNPYDLTYADTLVDGVPCVLGGYSPRRTTSRG
jgi:membrane peptidoglycan carboxypeptidase